jgi:hypothetical protein
MKTSILIVAAAAVCAGNLEAQVGPGTLTANVPFQFIHRGEAMSAGRYVVKSLGAAALVVTNASTRKAAAGIVTLGRSDGRGKLTFACYAGDANKCFLREVSTPESKVSQVFQMTSMEKEYRSNGLPRIAQVEAAIASRTGTAAE